MTIMSESLKSVVVCTKWDKDHHGWSIEWLGVYPGREIWWHETHFCDLVPGFTQIGITQKVTEPIEERWPSFALYLKTALKLGSKYGVRRAQT